MELPHDACASDHRRNRKAYVVDVGKAIDGRRNRKRAAPVVSDRGQQQACGDCDRVTRVSLALHHLVAEPPRFFEERAGCLGSADPLTARAGDGKCRELTVTVFAENVRADVFGVNADLGREEAPIASAIDQGARSDNALTRDAKAPNVGGDHIDGVRHDEEDRARTRFDEGGDEFVHQRDIATRELEPRTGIGRDRRRGSYHDNVGARASHDVARDDPRRAIGEGAGMAEIERLAFAAIRGAAEEYQLLRERAQHHRKGQRRSDLAHARNRDPHAPRVTEHALPGAVTMPAEENMTAGDDGQQLTPVRTAHRFDEKALERYLERHVPAVSAPLRVLQFEGGQSNPTFMLESGETRWVMRKKPPGELVPSAHAVDREFRVIAALAGSGVPLPKVEHFCDDPDVIGTPFYVMEFVEGRIEREVTLPDRSPAERLAIFDSMNRTIATLHSVDYASVGLEGYGKVGGYIERQVARWVRQYAKSKTEEIPAMEALMAWLPNHIPADDRTSIVHGDFRLENVVLHPTEPRILAVLDWELSTLGHPYADFAYNCMPFHLAPGEVGSLGGLDLEACGFPQESAYVADYARRVGRDSIPDWPFYMVFSMFRLAAIAHGVYVRGLQGNAASEEALERGARARSLAERGWEIAQTELGA